MRQPTTHPGPTPNHWPQVLLPTVVVIGALWSVIPVSIWFVGTAPSDFKDAWALWLLGGVITLGATLVAIILSGRRVNGWLFSIWRRGVVVWPTGRFLAVTAASRARKRRRRSRRRRRRCTCCTRRLSTLAARRRERSSSWRSFARRRRCIRGAPVSRSGLLWEGTQTRRPVRD